MLSLAAAGAARAHPGPHADFGFVSGVAHLFTEPDHLLAIVIASVAAVAALRARPGILRLGSAAITLAGISYVLLT